MTSSQPPLPATQIRPRSPRPARPAGGRVGTAPVPAAPLCVCFRRMSPRGSRATGNTECHGEQPGECRSYSWCGQERPSVFCLFPYRGRLIHVLATRPLCTEQRCPRASKPLAARSAGPRGPCASPGTSRCLSLAVSHTPGTAAGNGSAAPASLRYPRGRRGSRTRARARARAPRAVMWQSGRSDHVAGPVLVPV